MALPNFSIRCSALVFRGNQVLVVERRRDRQSYYVLPGGTPRPAESTASCVGREVEEETGLQVVANRVAFVLEANDHTDAHTLDIVFTCTESTPRATPQELEPGLRPFFSPADELGQLNLRPPLAGHIRGLVGNPAQRTGAYLGNLWRPTSVDELDDGGEPVSR